MMAAVFSMQGMGQLVAAIVALVATVGFKDSFINIKNVTVCDYACQLAADRSWRIIVGVGAIPAVFALYYRITIPETPRYTFDVSHDVEKADADVKAYMASKSEGEVDPIQQARMLKIASPSLNIPTASWRDVWSYFGQPKNLKVLIGTTLSWFFLVCPELPSAQVLFLLIPCAGPSLLRPRVEQHHRLAGDRLLQG
jgi:PHS family inorganic phosphate transporter-like MFS transporter